MHPTSLKQLWARFWPVARHNSDRRSVDRRRSERRQPFAVRPTHAYIDHDALTHNLGTVQRHVGDRCRILAVVKADAYGHQAVEAARTFVDAGAWGLAVSLVEEGIELRQGGIHAPVLVLGGVLPGSGDVIVHRSLTPIVWERAHLSLLSAAVRRAGAPPLPVHVKIDTGMSRLGLVPSELPALLDWFESEGDETLRLEGVMTHLPLADDPDENFSVKQVEEFRACLQSMAARGLYPEMRHVCNSAGLVRIPQAHFDMVRPGVALYGSASSRAVALPDLEQAMSVHSRIMGIRELPKGTAISYGHRHRLERDSRLGIVPMGYGDGYMRNMSGKAEMLVRGHRCRVVGNITMDVSMIDVTELPDARPGELVTLLGWQGRERIEAYDLANWAGVLPYEITCGISKRMPRR
jgi:alanine racemase